MAAPIDDEEKPLDPAVERVRRKLLRFVAINLGLLLVALMAVIGAIVYKWEPGGAGEPAQRNASQRDMVVQTIRLPRGARVISQSLSENRLSLHVDVDGDEAIVVYDITTSRVLHSFNLEEQ